LRRPKEAFFAFDREFRNALSSHDPGKLSLLVQFPLRVNDELGDFLLPDAASLQERFEKVFTSKVQRTVLSQAPESLFCNYQGVAYGNGTVWVSESDHGYRIETVNTPEPPQNSSNQAYHLKLACHTDRERIVVDQSQGKLRFRSWLRPHSLTQNPDIVIRGGTEKFEGTGPCAHAIWTFNNNPRNIEVQSLGCTDNTSPRDAIGTLNLSSDAEEDAARWCF